MNDWQGPGAEARRRMVEEQLVARGIHDPRVLAAMREVPREEFVEPGLRAHAYADSPLRIPDGQTISQPFIVALMAEAARIGPGDRVLEVGAGSGYAAAVLSRLGAQVFAIERHPGLAEAARERLGRLGFAVAVREGDGTLGWPEAAPFDAILVAAAGPGAPDALKGQLAPGGRLVLPVGPRDGPQDLVRVTRQGPEAWEEERLGGVRFVPLLGAQGWPEGGGAGEGV